MRRLRTLSGDRGWIASVLEWWLMRALQISFAILLCLSLVSFCAAQTHYSTTKHANIELLASSTSNQTLLGVHFILEKGWHIYWINPGDSGQPPAFTWTLPAGATAGDVQWPKPERLQSSPEIADYGYKDDVLLMIPLRVGSSQAGSPAIVKLEAKWLICREVCMPDHAQLSVSLPAASNRRVEELFVRTKERLPQPWPKQWNATAESQKDDFLLNVVTGKTISTAEFFPLDPGQIENAAKQRVQPTAMGVSLVLKKSDLLMKSLAELRGVLVIAGRAYQLRAPVMTQVALK